MRGGGWGVILFVVVYHWLAGPRPSVGDTAAATARSRRVAAAPDSRPSRTQPREEDHLGMLQCRCAADGGGEERGARESRRQLGPRVKSLNRLFYRSANEHIRIVLFFFLSLAS